MTWKCTLQHNYLSVLAFFKLWGGGKCGSFRFSSQLLSKRDRHDCIHSQIHPGYCGHLQDSSQISWFASLSGISASLKPLWTEVWPHDLLWPMKREALRAGVVPTVFPSPPIHSRMVEAGGKMAPLWLGSFQKKVLSVRNKVVALGQKIWELFVILV